MHPQSFTFRKLVDKSVLYQGFGIPVTYHDALAADFGLKLKHGEKAKVKVMIDDKLYDANLINQGFKRSKYPNHPDMFQLRYTEKSPIAIKIQQIFASTKAYIDPIQAMKMKGDRSQIRIPEEIQEFLTLSVSAMDGVFIMDYLTRSDVIEAKAEIKKIPEYQYEDETILKAHDDDAYITYGKSLQKIRHLDRSIGDSLKQLYDFRCQMTGERIGDSYDALVVEAHHIIPFTKSLNNDTSNIIILSPSYHRIIHRANPEFDRTNLQFVFPNGLKEKVKINLHL